MRYFINTSTDDFWTALVNDRIIESRTKPKPYKEHRELTQEELIVLNIKRSNLPILFHGHTNAKEKILQSTANAVCHLLPDLAKKHGLVYDRRHEYWRATED